jgi:hypothetical protein
MEQNASEQQETTKINYGKEDIVKIILGYQKLGGDGRFREFLNKVKKCDLCDNDDILYSKRPLNRIVNNLDLNAKPEGEAEKILQRYESFQKRFDRKPLSRFGEAEEIRKLDTVSDREFYEFVMKNNWPDDMGLSIGVCGWTDASMLLSKPNPEIMIIGADWYPLRSQSTFLTEREDHVLLNHMKFLSKLFPDKNNGERIEAWKTLFLKAGIYFTNAMLCYRPQTDKVGNQNIAPQSFLNCQEHLESQIKIIKPKLIITWGLQPALSILRYMAEQAAGSDISKELQELISGNFKFKELAKLNEMTPLKIPAPWGGDVYIHILCHPSMPNRWGKQPDGTFLDYSNLRKWLGGQQWI